MPGVTNIASAGDLNGDGYDDLVVGVYAADRPGAVDAGSTYVVFGHGGGFAGTVDLTTLDSSHGFRIDGVSGTSSGWSVATAGDFNGDGYADLLVSAHTPPSTRAGGGTAGAAYVLYGHAGTFGDIDLGHLSASQGLALSNPDPGSHGFGMTVAAAGDVNGDGFADIAISNYANKSTYVVFGGNFTGSVDHLGTAQSDTLTGGPAAETFVGGDGKDVVYGGGGADSIEGGAGSDVIHVAFAPPAGESYTDTNHNNQYDPGEPFADYNQNGVHDGPSTGSDVFRHVDGGSGFDFLYLDAGGALDFSNLDGNPTTSNRGKISNIESLNFNNGFQNDVTLHKADVLDTHPSDDHLATLSTPEHILYLHGDANDTLHLATADHWTLQAPGTIPGYAVYASDEVKIAVEGMAVHVDLPN